MARGLNKAQAAAAQAQLLDAPETETDATESDTLQLPESLQSKPGKKRGRKPGSKNKVKEYGDGPRPGRPRKSPVATPNANDDGLVGLLAVIVQSGKTASYWLPIIDKVKGILEKK